ncbi:MAG: ATP-binding cassette domain-containing protein [Candidatus Marinimicrobia bacterium]|nr:ATP-binding cassette domain-containing protein [Candidatus Neomarinimicrobiota bacterium]
MLKLESVWKYARNHTGPAVLRDCSYHFVAGRIYAVLGPSGVGKTTLLKTLNHLLPLDRGRILFGDEDIALMPPQQVRRQVSMQFQTPAFLADTVEEELRSAARFCGRDHINPSEFLELVRLNSDFLPLMAKTLSIGEQQRVCLARTLVTLPRVLLLDEPTAALDDSTAEFVIETIRSISRAAGLLTILVTHRKDHAAELGDVVVQLDGGQLMDQDS